MGSLSLLAITGLFLYGHNEAHAVPIFIVAVNHFSTAVLVSAVTVLILHLTINRIVQSEQQNRQQAQTVAKLNAELQLEMRARIQTEKLLYQKQKLESTGLLAGGIAHDFNNLFTSVLGQASLAQRHLAPEHKAYRHLEKSMKAVQQAAELTRQLLAYTGKSNVDVEGLPATSETFIYLAMIRIIRCRLT